MLAELTEQDVDVVRLLISIRGIADMLIDQGMPEEHIPSALFSLVLAAKAISGHKLADGESEGQLSDRFTRFMFNALGEKDGSTSDPAIRMMIHSQVLGEKADVKFRESLGLPVKQVALELVDDDKKIH